MGSPTSPNEHEIKILGEIYNKLFSQYESKKQRFERIFIILIIASIFFLFIILAPYVAIQHENKQILDRIARDEQEIKARSISVNASLKSSEAYRELLHDILKTPSYLVQFSKSLNDSTNVADSSFDPCSGFVDLDERARCKMKGEIFSLTNNYSFVYPRIVTPLFLVYSDGNHIRHLLMSLNISANNFLHDKEFYVPLNATRPAILNFLDSPYTSARIDFIEGADPASHALYEIFIRINLDQEIRNLSQTFLQLFEQNPNFWKAQESNRQFYDQLNHTVSEFIRNNPGNTIYGSLYDRIVKVFLEEEIKRLNQSQKEKTDLLNRLSQVEDRLEEIQTPFGNIPIIFNEAIYIFPLAVSGTFLICAFSYVDSVRVRKALHDLYYSADFPKVFRKIDTYIDKIAPLWLDPINQDQHKFLLFILLFLPFIIFVLSSGFVFYSWILSNISIDRPSNILAYFPLYTATLFSWDPNDTQDVINQVLYNYFDWSIPVNDESEHVLLGLLKWSGAIKVDSQITQIPVYSVFQSLADSYNDFEFVLVLMLLVDENDFVFSIVYLILYLTSLVLLIWSYKIIIEAYCKDRAIYNKKRN
jgi:hypothetical protein